MNDLFAQIKDSKLHDYELLTVSVDYSSANIKIHLCSPQGTKSIISIDDFIQFSISHTEKWGKGTYIVSSGIVKKDLVNEINIELNSGDVITFKHKEMQKERSTEAQGTVLCAAEEKQR